MRAISAIVLSVFLLEAEVQDKGKAKAVMVQGGIKTPGIQIPFASLKQEAVVNLDSPGNGLLFNQNLLVAMGTKIGRIDTKKNQALEAWTVGETLCGGMVSAFEHIWAPACGKNGVLKIDPKKGNVVATLAVGAQAGTQTIAASGDSIWAITDAQGTLSRIDPKENTVVAEIRLPVGCNSLAFEADFLWATCPTENRLLKIDAKQNVVLKRIETAAEPYALAFAEATLFVLGKKDGKISKVDPKTDKVTGSIETLVSGAAGQLSSGEGFLWVSQSGFPLSKIDMKNDKVMQQFFGEAGGSVKFAAGALWMLPTGKAQVLRIDPKRVALTLAE